MNRVTYNFPLDPSGHSESELITALYLYGENVEVENGKVKIPQYEELLDSNLIRPELIVPANATNQTPLNITLVEAIVDSVDYMNVGPGRFANGHQFDLVNAFFGLDSERMYSDNGKDNYQFNSTLLDQLGTPVYDQQGNSIGKKYSKEEIDQIYFQGQLGTYSATLELRNYDDNFDNYDQRVYVWNSQQFSLPDNVEFIIKSDGTREIHNFIIEPNRREELNLKENFDFDTANPVVEIGSGLILEPRVDPSGIGRTVYIDFYNRGNLSIYDPVDENESAGVYNLIDFNADLARERLFYQPNFFGVIEPVTREARKLFEAGVTKFLYQNKPIVYGSDGQDIFAPIEINSVTYPYQSDFKSNGYVFIGGEDTDSLPGGFNDDILIGNEGDDVITGDNPFSNLIGGDDTLDGGEGNDELNGDTGEDVAIFSDNFQNYEYEISEDEKTITINHIDGTQKDGTDTLKNIEWAEFGREQVETGTLVASSNQNGIPIATEPRLIPLPLTDGVENTKIVEASSTVANPNPNDPPTPPHISLTAPVAMLDGDVDYTLNISPYEPDTEYNVVYVIDTSISIDAVELQTIQDAYAELTNFYINEGIAENINFGVVSFDSSGRFHTASGSDRNLTANEAITALQNLTIDTRIGTRYYDGLNQADQFLLNSSKNPFETIGIGYFITDGQNSGDRLDMLLKARDVRELANFQAIGYYTDLDTLDSNSLQIRDVNWIDSNQGVFIDNLSDLSTELLKSDLADDIESVNILLDGEIVDTIAPEQLTDSPLGLTYEGSVDELDVSIDAENVITAEVVFTDEANLATTTLDFTVTAGESQAVDSEGNAIAQSSDSNEDPFEKTLDGGESDDEITLGYADRGANGGAGGDKIIGNRRDNILDGGAGNDTISAYEGNDRITTGEGRDKVNGGAGIDTAIYEDVAYGDGSNVFLSQVGSSVSYNNTDTLTDIEFIQFSDVRISTETLNVTPVLEVSEARVIEGNSRNTFATFNFDLSTPAPVDVQFDYSTQDIDAVAGEDYISASGQVVIPAGETTASAMVEIIGDTAYDELTETFAINLSGLSGATFTNNEAEYDVVAYIENREEGVVDENNQPVLVNPIDDLATTEDEAFSFTIAEDTFNDVDARDTLTYTATLSDGSELPSWLSFNADTRTFSGTPVNNDVGTLNVRVTATDLAGESVSDDFDLEVINLNDAPFVANAIASQTATEDETFSFTLPQNTFNDVDAEDTLTYTATLADGSELPGWLTFDADTRTLSGNPVNNDVGTLNVQITATDLEGETASDTFDLEVVNVNDTPLDINLSNTSIDENSSDGTIIGNLSTVDPDVDDTYSYTLLNSADRRFVINGSQLKVANGDLLDFEANSSHFINIQTTDAGGLSVTKDFRIDLNDLNEAPIAVSDSFTANSKSAKVITIETLLSNDRDPENDSLSLVAVDNAVNGTVVIDNDNIVFTPDGNSSIGSFDYTINDGVLNNSASVTLNVEVAEVGSNDNDTIIGTPRNDVYQGLDGNDSISGKAGNDLIRGDANNDTLDGGINDDTVIGGFGNDNLYGGDDYDLLYGESDNDILYGDGGIDWLRGGDDEDTLFGGEGNDTLKGDNQRDRLYGQNGNDELYGGDDYDLLYGNLGNDILYGDGGIDWIRGGDDEDILFGGEGNDTLKGDNQNDELYGGNGNDSLFGGVGEDSFVFSNTNQGVDIITDFSVQDDTLVFSAAGFEGLGGMVSSEMLTIGTAATSNEHRFIYNSGSGDLFYDSDGMGNNSQIKLASLTPSLALTNNNFDVE